MEKRALFEIGLELSVCILIIDTNASPLMWYLWKKKSTQSFKLWDYRKNFIIIIPLIITYAIIISHFLHANRVKHVIITPFMAPFPYLAKDFIPDGIIGMWALRGERRVLSTGYWALGVGKWVLGGKVNLSDSIWIVIISKSSSHE